MNNEPVSEQPIAQPVTGPVEPSAEHRKLNAMPAVTCSAWLGDAAFVELTSDGEKPSLRIALNDGTLIWQHTLDSDDAEEIKAVFSATEFRSVRWYPDLR